MDQRFEMITMFISKHLCKTRQLCTPEINSTKWLVNSLESEGNNVMICCKNWFSSWRNFNYYEEKFGAHVWEDIFGEEDFESFERVDA